MSHICIHAIVSGKVQGVWFRKHTQKIAKSLGITGWVRNLSDGRVEVMACGEQEQINQLHDWLEVGPKAARVDDLFSEEVDFQTFDNFVIR